LKQSQYQDHW